MAKRDYYDVLGVSKSANTDEIRRAHRKLVRQYHPDVNKDNQEAVAKFQEVQEAYDVLSDAEKRKNYDQFGHAGVNGGDPFENLRRGAGGGTWNSGGATVQDFDPRDFSNSADFGDIFEQFFGRGGGGGGFGGARTQARGGRTRARAEPAAAPRGADIEHSVTLNFDQAARGVTLPLQISRDGRLETIDVKIPAGVKDGSKVRLKGKGQHVPGGEAGDLYIITSVRPHDVFRRDDLDILVDVPISVYDALLGTKANVQTLDGPVTITVPPGTSSGAKLRIKGRGVFRGDEKGDQHCVIKIIVPKDLDDDDKEMIRKLQEKRPVNLPT